MKREIELLAPGGDIDSIKAAIVAGANAVYCGLDKFNARNRAANISLDNLNGILHFAHKNNCQVFLTLNILIIESEIPAFIALLNKLVNTTIDGVIVQDLGVFYLLNTYFKSLKIHASTQLTTHNKGQIKFLRKLNVSRVNLSRELNSKEIKTLAEVGHKNEVLTEVFVHGSYCVSFSGLCYMSSVHGGNSGNRGRCSQPCRDQYRTTQMGKNFPLNLKDNSLYLDVNELADAGVDSFKIEGRIKKFHYVYSVVKAWKEQLKNLKYGNLNADNSILYKVFNRDFTNSFFKGDIHKNMFIDNSRDHSAIHLAKTNGTFTKEGLEKAKGDIYDERTELIQDVRKLIQPLSIEKTPIIITVSGKEGSPLKVVLKTPDSTFETISKSALVKQDSQTLDKNSLLKRLKVINETEYYIQNINITKLGEGLFIPFNELTAIKRRMLFLLSGSEYIDPIEVPKLKNNKPAKFTPTLSVLISSSKDLYLLENTSADIYFQLPNAMGNSLEEQIPIFTENKSIIPWFPSILIGEDYNAAINFLDKIKPTIIVSNNTGIANEACEKGISWIAGPQMNLVNSYSLINLKENFNCSGAFISNELNQQQIKSIKKPDDFKLYYSIYQPLVLMTSRQCLFHQITGCEKEKMDKACLRNCKKHASITNLKETTFILNKTKGSYNRIYNEANFLNTDIVNDISNFFSSYLIDLSEIKTGTKLEASKSKIVKLFENHLKGNPNSVQDILRNMYPTTFTPYVKGI